MMSKTLLSKKEEKNMLRFYVIKFIKALSVETNNIGFKSWLQIIVPQLSSHATLSDFLRLHFTTYKIMKNNS